MTSDQSLSFAAEQVRRFDRERFVTALFASPEKREALMVLYAFNVEVSRVRESVRESIAGLVRLQWWRDVLAGTRPSEAARHPVAGPLTRMQAEDGLPLRLFEDVLEGREQDLVDAPPADLAALEAYAAATSGSLAQLALASLGVRGEASLATGRAVGTAFAMVGLVRALPYHLSIGRLTLPASVLEMAGTNPDAVLAGQAPRESLARAAEAVSLRAGEILAEARRAKVEKRGIAALLPAVLASGHLKRLKAAGFDPFNSKVALPNPMPVRLTLATLLGRF